MIAVIRSIAKKESFDFPFGDAVNYGLNKQQNKSDNKANLKMEGDFRSKILTTETLRKIIVRLLNR
jgi:hypothetical protein